LVCYPRHEVTVNLALSARRRTERHGIPGGLMLCDGVWQVEANIERWSSRRPLCDSGLWLELVAGEWRAIRKLSNRSDNLTQLDHVRSWCTCRVFDYWAAILPNGPWSRLVSETLDEIITFLSHMPYFAIPISTCDTSSLIRISLKTNWRKRVRVERTGDTRGAARRFW